MLLDRIWCIANKVTGEILYTSNQYTLAKKVFDYLLQLSPDTSDCKASVHRLYRGVDNKPVLELLRYDLSRPYKDFGACLRQALVETPFNPLSTNYK